MRGINLLLIRPQTTKRHTTKDLIIGKNCGFFKENETFESEEIEKHQVSNNENLFAFILNGNYSISLLHELYHFVFYPSGGSGMLFLKVLLLFHELNNSKFLSFKLPLLLAYFLPCELLQHVYL